MVWTCCSDSTASHFWGVSAAYLSTHWGTCADWQVMTPAESQGSPWTRPSTYLPVSHPLGPEVEQQTSHWRCLYHSNHRLLHILDVFEVVLVPQTSHSCSLPACQSDANCHRSFQIFVDLHACKLWAFISSSPPLISFYIICQGLVLWLEFLPWLQDWDSGLGGSKEQKVNVCLEVRACVYEMETEAV